MIRIGILGYGNIGRGVEKAVRLNKDMKLAGIFTRRLQQVSEQISYVPVFHYSIPFVSSEVPKIDVMILCGGSKEDIPNQGPAFASLFNTVDSFDTHADIPGYFRIMDSIAKDSNNVSIISAGWDPGIFSLERVLGDAFLPGSKSYTFWGRGVSQGHSDAVRRIEGVLDARQYTIPIYEAIQQVRAGEKPNFSKRDMHKRLVYVVAKKGADRGKIRGAIVHMPKYFDEYDTEVVFITAEKMKENHSTYPHGGFVMNSGATGNNKHILEYRCNLESNPEFTASVLVACARAAFRIKERGDKGAFTLLDIPLGLLSPHSPEELRSKFI